MPGKSFAVVKFSGDFECVAEDVKKLVDDGWLKNAFNQYASDMISVHRSLPDPRDEW